MSLRTTFRFESKGISFELIGSEDYVRQHLDLFLPLMGGAGGRAQETEQDSPTTKRSEPDRPEALKAWYDRHVSLGMRLTMQDHILVFALWMRTFRKFIFTSEDIRRGFREVDVTTPKSLLQILGTLKRDRNLILGTERRGEYMLNTTGIERARSVLGIRSSQPSPPPPPGHGDDEDSDSASQARTMLGL